MPGIKKAKGSPKYNKVNQQKKYHLLTLYYTRGLSLREAAELVGINYLTAKTILFFHKNNHKSYQFDLAPPHPTSPAAIECPTACYCPLRKKNTVEEKMHYRKARIQVVCSIGNVLNVPRDSSDCSRPETCSNCPMSSTIKNESFCERCGKGYYQLAAGLEPTPSPTLHICEEPQLEAYSLNLRVAARVEHAANKLLYGVEMVKIALPTGAEFIGQ